MESVERMVRAGTQVKLDLQGEEATANEAEGAGADLVDIQVTKHEQTCPAVQSRDRQICQRS